MHAQSAHRLLPAVSRSARVAWAGKPATRSVSAPLRSVHRHETMRFEQRTDRFRGQEGDKAVCLCRMGRSLHHGDRIEDRRVAFRGEGGDEGLALTGLHLGDVAEVEGGTWVWVPREQWPWLWQTLWPWTSGYWELSADTEGEGTAV